MTKSRILIVLIALFFVSCDETQDKRTPLPIWGNRDVEYKMVDGKEVADTIYHVVPSFAYLNQDSVWVSSNDLKDKILVADFFFTNCPSICPPMTTNMKRLNIMTEDLKDKLQFVSFSIDPKRDTPSRIQEYIKLHGIKATNWMFFTGIEAEKTHALAGEFFTFANRDEEVPGGFGHQSHFVLIDTKGHVRGVYDGLKNKEIDSMASDIRFLLEDEYNFTGSK